jgi:2-acylglycerol O-acyltransferase 2
MAANIVSVPLSAEPSNPTEREDRNLEPKSYVDAVQQEAVTNGTGPYTNGEEPDRQHLTDITNGNGSSNKTVTNNENVRPQVDRQESKQEYSAVVSIC